MSTVISTTVFQYDELSDSAKEKARDWFTKDGDHWGPDNVYEDAARMAELMGLDIRLRQETRKDKSTFWGVSIFYSGFCSQGDGACFEGIYGYKKGALAAVKAETNDAELIRICQGLQDLQRKFFYSLTARTKHSGHYYHSRCMDITVESDRFYPGPNSQKELEKLFIDFADWIYKQLEADYDYASSEENVAENIRGNEYTFTEEGRRFG